MMIELRYRHSLPREILPEFLEVFFNYVNKKVTRGHKTTQPLVDERYRHQLTRKENEPI